jgi:hypothetical protein
MEAHEPSHAIKVVHTLGSGCKEHKFIMNVDHLPDCRLPFKILEYSITCKIIQGSLKANQFPQRARALNTTTTVVAATTSTTTATTTTTTHYLHNVLILCMFSKEAINNSP